MLCSYHSQDSVFVFVFVFQLFGYHMFTVDFFEFPCSEFVELFRCVDSGFSTNLGSLEPLFLQIFCLPLSLLSSGTPTHVYIGMLDAILQVSEVCSFSSFLFIFLNFILFFQCSDIHSLCIHMFMHFCFLNLIT